MSIPHEKIRFDDRAAIITGGGGALGRAYALELARRGAKIVINDCGGSRDGRDDGSDNPADSVAEEIGALGGEVAVTYDTVATASGGERIVETALDAFGRVDILINNAGVLRDRSFLKLAPEDWHAVLDVHLNGAYNVTRPAFGVMKERGYGRIVMTTSAAGLYGNFGQTNYSAAKMGLVGLMNTLKLEGAKYDIRVNTVAPVAASRLTADILPPDVMERLKPEYVAPIVLYLASEECPVTGKIYNAGMGACNRVALVTAPGGIIGDGQNMPTVDDVAASWDRLSSLKDAKEYENLNEVMIDLFQSLKS